VRRLVNGPFVTRAKGHRLDVPEGSKRLGVFVRSAPGQWMTARGGRALAARDRRAGIGQPAVRAVTAQPGPHRPDHGGQALPAPAPERRGRRSSRLRVGCRLISGRHSYRDLRILPTPIDALDLLPGWYDDWVLLARERLRQQVIGPVVARLAAAGDGCCSSRRRASPGGVDQHESRARQAAASGARAQRW
jgi:hypothetical protein